MGLPIESDPTGATASAPQTPGPLYGWAMIWTLLGVFAGGMALNLTPCVYPLIPITVSYFGGQAAKDQRGPRQAPHSRRLLYARACRHQFDAWGCCGTDRRSDGGSAAKPGCPGWHRGHFTWICSKPFRVVGTAPAERPHPGRREIIHRLFRKSFHGPQSWRCRRPLHRPLRAGAFDLGSGHGESRDWVSGILRPQPGAGAAAFASGHFRGANQQASARGRLDALGQKGDGLGSGWNGRPFCEPRHAGGLE